VLCSLASQSEELQKEELRSLSVLALEEEAQVIGNSIASRAAAAKWARRVVSNTRACVVFI